MVTCDYCLEGNIAEDGWHRYPVMADEGYEIFDQPYRVPCAIDPPKVGIGKEGEEHVAS